MINVVSLGLVWIFGIIFSLLSFTIETIVHYHHRVGKRKSFEDKFRTSFNIVDDSKLEPETTLSNESANRKMIEENLEQLLHNVCFDKVDKK